MKIYLGADHNGFELKGKIALYLAKRNLDYEDVGAFEFDKDDDFPKYGAAAALKIIGSEDENPQAILICGSGQGIAIAANRFNGIRAAVIRSVDEVKLPRNDDDANVLCLPAYYLKDQDDSVWQEIVDAWLETPFAGKERFVRRNAQLDELR